MMLFARKKSKSRILYKAPKPLTAFDKVEAVVDHKKESEAAKTATGSTYVSASHNTSTSSSKNKKDCSFNSSNSSICRNSCNLLASAKVSVSSEGSKKDSNLHNHVNVNVNERNEKNVHNKNAASHEEKASNIHNAGKSAKEVHDGKQMKTNAEAVTAEKTSTTPRNEHDSINTHKTEKLHSHVRHTPNLESTCSPSTVVHKNSNVPHKRKKGAAKKESTTINTASGKTTDARSNDIEQDAVENVKGNSAIEADNEITGGELRQDSNISDEAEELHDSHKDSVLSNTLNSEISRTMPTEESELSNTITTNTMNTTATTTSTTTATTNTNSKPKAKKTKKKIIIRKKKKVKPQEPKKEEKLLEEEEEENVITSHEKNELDSVETTPRHRREERAPSMEALSLLAKKKVSDEVDNSSLTSDPTKAQRANKLETWTHIALMEEEKNDHKMEAVSSASWSANRRESKNEKNIMNSNSHDLPLTPSAKCNGIMSNSKWSKSSASSVPEAPIPLSIPPPLRAISRLRDSSSLTYAQDKTSSTAIVVGSSNNNNNNNNSNNNINNNEKKLNDNAHNTMGVRQSLLSQFKEDNNGYRGTLALLPSLLKDTPEQDFGNTLLLTPSAISARRKSRMSRQQSSLSQRSLNQIELPLPSVRRESEVEKLIPIKPSRTSEDVNNVNNNINNGRIHFSINNNNIRSSMSSSKHNIENNSIYNTNKNGTSDSNEPHNVTLTSVSLPNVTFPQLCPMPSPVSERSKSTSEQRHSIQLTASDAFVVKWRNGKNGNGEVDETDDERNYNNKNNNKMNDTDNDDTAITALSSPTNSVSSHEHNTDNLKDKYNESDDNDNDDDDDESSNNNLQNKRKKETEHEEEEEEEQEEEGDDNTSSDEEEHEEEEENDDDDDENEDESESESESDDETEDESDDESTESESASSNSFCKRSNRSRSNSTTMSSTTNNNSGSKSHMDLSAAMRKQFIIVKISEEFATDVKLFYVKKKFSFATFINDVKKRFKYTKKSDFELYYLDKNGEKVQIANKNDLV